MSEYEIITGSPADFDWLPAGTVLRGEPGGDDGAVAVRIKGGWSFTNRGGDRPAVYPYLYGKVYEVLYRPVVAPKVGDVIETEEQAKLLPIGSVAVELDEDQDAVAAPAIKVTEQLWLYYNDDDEAPEVVGHWIIDNNPHRVIHIPVSADAGAGSTAA